MRPPRGGAQAAGHDVIRLTSTPGGRGVATRWVARKYRQPALLKQLTSGDPLALGKAAKSRHSENLTARTKTADRVVQSICN